MKSNKPIALSDNDFLTLIGKIVEYLKQTGIVQETQWVNESDAMKLLNLRRVALWKLRATGQLEYSKIGRKVILYNRKSIVQFIERHIQKTF